MNKCEQCSYSTVMSVNFLVHLRKHKGERPFKCDQCPYEASQQTILKIHKRSVHENLYFECQQCEYKASQKSNLKTHIHKIHKGGKRKSAKSIIVKETCTVCGEKVRKEYLKEHTERRHLGRGLCSRQIVDYLADSREHLEVRYNCDESDFHGDSKSNLIMKVEHKNGIKYKCEKCEYQAASKQYLRIHVEKEHLGITYKCEECEPGP